MSKTIFFCFTYAGGTAAFFDSIKVKLKDKYEVVCFDYPGHGARHREPLCNDFAEVCDILYPEVKQCLLENGMCEYALMGYSMGSLVAFAMLQRIVAMGEFMKPRHIFLAAHEPMTKSNILDIPAGEMDDFIRERTIAFRAVPKKLIDNKSFWRMYLPIYKADYLMIARYRFEDISFVTDVPCTVFYSEEDTKYEDMKDWTKYFYLDCKFVEYNGPHFFINEYYKEMAQVMMERF